MIGFLDGWYPEGFDPYVAAFRQGLSETGNVDGKRVTIEYRWVQRETVLMTSVISRRTFLQAIGGTVLMPLAAEAQPATKVPRVGVLSGGSLSEPVRTSAVDAFQQGLRELGYVEGQSIVIEYRWADYKHERLPDLAAELVRLKVDVIVATIAVAVQAAKHATKTIPIVMVANDPVAAGFAASVARPEGNITGLSMMTPAVSLGLIDKDERRVIQHLSRIRNRCVHRIQEVSIDLRRFVATLEKDDLKDFIRDFAFYGYAAPTQAQRALLEHIALTDPKHAMWTTGLIILAILAMHTEMSDACRSPRRAAYEVRTRHQREDRQDPRADDSAVVATTSGSAA